jgi:hypothetical protein
MKGPTNPPRIINLQRIADAKGNLTPIEGGRDLPFEILSAFYTYDIPGGESRGGHAHYKMQQFIIAASGSFEVVIDDGRQQQSFFLNRSYYGLYLPPMIWRDLTNFSSGSVCLVFASERYDELDYIRDHGEFQRIARGR